MMMVIADGLSVQLRIPPTGCVNPPADHTVRPEIKISQSIKIIPRTHKNILRINNCFLIQNVFDSKCFFAFNSESARPDTQKHFRPENKFRSEMNHSGLYWFILAHFGSIPVKMLFRFKMFFESKCFFAFSSKSARPDSQTNKLNRKSNCE